MSNENNNNDFATFVRGISSIAEGNDTNLDALLQNLSSNMQQRTIMMSTPLNKSGNILKEYNDIELAKRYQMDHTLMSANQISGHRSNMIAFDDIEMRAVTTTGTYARSSEPELSYEHRIAINKYNSDESTKRYKQSIYKLSPDLKINKSTFNESQRIGKTYNKNGYNHKIETIIEKYLTANTFKSKYLNRIIDSENIRLSKEIIEFTIKDGFFKSYEKELEIEIIKFEYDLESTNFLVTIEHDFGITEIIFETNCPTTMLLDGLVPKYKRITTYNTTIKTSVKQNTSIIETKVYRSTANELLRQKNPESSLSESLSRISKPDEVVELSSTRAGLHNMEKLISFIYANIDFIQNLVRMYITNNEFETFLYMYKTKIEAMSFAGCDISGEIDTATEVLYRLEESIV